jgi:hypothetical protein
MEQTMAQDEEGLLKRWSRRKLEQREREREVVPPQPDEESGGKTEVTTTGEGSPTDAPAAAATLPDLPPIESLTRDSDFTVFMREGVPDDLRNLALRKLWRSDPVFANLDGMLEYGEDYSQWFKPGVGAALKTLYRVGQGYLANDAEAVPESPAEGSNPVTDAAAPSAETATPDPNGENRDGGPTREAGAEMSESTDAETPTTAESEKG